jgi:TonB-linked SusC/RagA family outer membrane protein
VIDANAYKRYTLISNLSIRLAKNLLLDLQTSFRSGKTFSQGGPTVQTAPFNAVLQASPISPVYNKNGSYYGAFESSNPLANIVPEGGQTKETPNYFNGNASFVYNTPFLKGLTLKAAFNLERGYYYKNIYRSPVPVFVPDANSANGYRQTGGGTSPNLNELWGQSNTTNIDMSAAYNKTMGQHQLDVLVLGTQNEMTANYNTLFRDGLIRGIQSINAGSPVNQTMSGAPSQAGRAAFLGRVNYQYANKYYAEFSMRADGSTKFPENNRWGYFPAVSAGWRISRENFIANNSKSINDLKVRVSAGTTGDDNISAFTYYYNYNPATSGSSGSSGYIFGNTYAPSLFLANSTLPNINITWAESFMVNLGLDFTLWNGKLGGSFDIYRKDLKNMLRGKAQNIPASFGIGAPILNFAKEQYSGFEFELTHSNHIGKDFSYNLRGTFTYNKGRVIDYGEDPATLDYLKAEGYSPFKTTVYKAAGFFQTQEEILAWVNQDGLGNTSLKPGDVKYVDLNKDGKIDAKDQLSYNNMVFPPMGFGLNTGATYKNFNVDIFFQGSAGNKLLISPPQLTKEYYDNRWTPETPNTKYPRLSTKLNNNPVLFPSTLNLYDGAYVRLRNLQIGYTISPDVLKRIGLRTFKVYFSGTNLLTFSKYKEFDPEVPNVTGAQSGGFYPTQKTIGFGMQLGF